jgi:hypothetical protein
VPRRGRIDCGAGAQLRSRMLRRCRALAKVPRRGDAGGARPERGGGGRSVPPGAALSHRPSQLPVSRGRDRPGGARGRRAGLRRGAQSPGRSHGNGARLRDGGEAGAGRPRRAPLSRCARPRRCAESLRRRRDRLRGGPARRRARPGRVSMLDIRLIREKPDDVKAALATVGVEAGEVDAVLSLDERRRALIGEVEGLRNERGVVSKRIGKMSAAEPSRWWRTCARSAIASPAWRRTWRPPRRTSRRRCSRCRTYPIPTSRSARRVGQRRRARGRRGAALRLRAAAALGPRPRARHHRLRARREDLRARASTCCSGRGRACSGRSSTWMLDLHVASTATRGLPAGDGARGVPLGTGNLPKFGDNLYRDAEEDFWFVPTAEVPVTNLYRDEILRAEAAADPPRRLQPVLPAREDVGRARRARHQARAPVRQGRDGEVRPSRASDAELV